MTPTSRWSLQFQMPMAAVSLLLLLAAALTTATIREVRRQARSLAGARLADAADQMRTATAGSVQRAFDRMTAVTASPLVANLVTGMPGDTATIRATLAPLLGNDRFTALVLWDTTGRAVLVGAMRGDTTGWITPPDRIDTLHLSTLAVLRDSVVVFDLVAPVRRGGRVVGALQHRTRVSATPTDAARTTSLMGEGGVLLVGSRGGIWTDLSRTVDPPADRAISADSAVSYRRDGAERLGIGRSMADAPWVFVAELPMAVVMAPTREVLLRHALIAAVLVAITALAAWLLGRGITLPLRSLHHAVLLGQQQRTAVRATVHGHPEIAGVAAAFNEMAAATEAQLEAIEASEQRFRSLVVASAQVVFWVAADGQVHDRLETWEAFTGQTTDEARGFGWLDAVHPEDRAAVRLGWRQAIAQRASRETEYRIRRFDGVYRLCRARGVPVLGDDGMIREWVGTYDDITDLRWTEAMLRRREDELHQAQRLDAIGRLAGGVAHDVNNLLTAIVVPAEEAVGLLGADHPAQQQLREIGDAGRRAAGLTRQLLAFGRKQVLKPVVAELDEAVAAQAQLLRRVIPESVTIELVLRGEGGMVRVDRSQLDQVILNLALNARDAMPRGGHLTLATSRVELTAEFCERHEGVQPGPFLQLAMTDSGHGMSEAVRSQAFEPFFTTKEPGEGTGLGMSTVYGIVRQSGGQIWLESEPGKGTTARVVFPVAASADQVTETDRLERRPVPTGTGTILLAEDDPALRRIGVRVLSALGYTVIAAEHGEAALAAAAVAGPIDLLVTDVVMPGIGGAELWDRLHALRPELKVLFLSGWASDAVVRHRILEGDVPFVQKPFTLEELGRKVHELLHG